MNGAIFRTGSGAIAFVLMWLGAELVFNAITGSSSLTATGVAVGIVIGQMRW